MSSVGLEVFAGVADADGRATGRTPGLAVAMAGFVVVVGVAAAAVLADAAGGAAAVSETAGGATLVGGVV